MILVVRVNDVYQTYSPKDNREAMQRIVELHKKGAFVNYWEALPEGMPWGKGNFDVKKC